MLPDVELAVNGRDVMREPWSDRRKRLEDVDAVLDSRHVAIVPVTDDAQRLWALWIGQQGGEGIVFKDRRAPTHRPGERSPDWLKVNQRLMLRVRVLGGERELIKWER
jgi:ATP-dependent DNA ligase